MNIWNCFHGCKKYSDGCKNCYMYYLDNSYTKGKVDSSNVYLVKSQINYPLEKNRYGKYKIKSGETVHVGLNTDFFLTKEEVGDDIDKWREMVWDIIRKRRDVKFKFLTKRAFNIVNCLPDDWGEGYLNVEIGVTVESEKYVDRLEILKNIPAKHKSVMLAPLISDIDLDYYLEQGFLDYVICGGENYGNNTRICEYKWVSHIAKSCKKYNTTFIFIETGQKWIDENGEYWEMPSKIVENREAIKTNLSFLGKKAIWELENIDEFNKFQSYFPPWCEKCSSRLTCQGCNKCGKCKRKIEDY